MTPTGLLSLIPELRSTSHAHTHISVYDKRKNYQQLSATNAPEASEKCSPGPVGVQSLIPELMSAARCAHAFHVSSRVPRKVSKSLFAKSNN